MLIVIAGVRATNEACTNELTIYFTFIAVLIIITVYDLNVNSYKFLCFTCFIDNFSDILSKLVIYLLKRKTNKELGQMVNIQVNESNDCGGGDIWGYGVSLQGVNQ